MVMTCGAGGALNVVLKTILNPGEEVIILAPYFVEYKFYIDNHGGVTREVWTDRETFQLDIDGHRRGDRTANTRAVIINSPNNPTGVIYPAESLQALGEMLRAKGEGTSSGRSTSSPTSPTRGWPTTASRSRRSFRYVKNSVIVTSHSKDLALPGERIGYLAANPRHGRGRPFMEGAVFCNRVLGFVNAPALMQRLVAKLQRESVDIGEYQEKRDLLYDHLTALGFEMVKPGGGFYLFPQSPLADDVEFVRLAQKHNILLVPGAGFGAPGYFRIAYCIDEEIIRRSLPAWEKLAEEAGL